MPWVLKDYTSDVLDLQSPNTYRDLTKSIGGQGDPERLSKFKERY